MNVHTIYVKLTRKRMFKTFFKTSTQIIDICNTEENLLNTKYLFL